MRELLLDLVAEQDDLDRLVAGLVAEQWDLPTPAEPWSIRDTISHLAFFDERQTQAILDPEGFAREVNQRLAGDYDDYMAIGLNHGRSVEPPEVLDWWRSARAEELTALWGLAPEQQLPWYGPPLKARSAAAARLMETWAHGHDVAQALSLDRPPTERLFHIAELGVKTFSWSFLNRGLDVPSKRVRVELTGPAGNTRLWNEGSDESISGPAPDFCLVVAQRINYRDTDLKIEGEIARKWMEIAQIFAGPPGPGRPPRSG
ncbi:MAG: TIGR03084 family metal-binding protein [Acidimicrobiia bacterium]